MCSEKGLSIPGCAPSNYSGRDCHSCPGGDDRFAANPKWLIYLPSPLMSPCETSRKGRHFGSPQEALIIFALKGILKVVCEKKHMGSRGGYRHQPR